MFILKLHMLRDYRNFNNIKLLLLHECISIFVSFESKAIQIVNSCILVFIRLSLLVPL